MASQSSSSMFLPKPMWLEGEENYEDWKDNITLLLGSKGLARFMKKGSVPDPDSGRRTGPELFDCQPARPGSPPRIARESAGRRADERVAGR